MTVLSVTYDSQVHLLQIGDIDGPLQPNYSSAQTLPGAVGFFGAIPCLSRNETAFTTLPLGTIVVRRDGSTEAVTQDNTASLAAEEGLSPEGEGSVEGGSSEGSSAEGTGGTGVAEGEGEGSGGGGGLSGGVLAAVITAAALFPILLVCIVFLLWRFWSARKRRSGAHGSDKDAGKIGASSRNGDFSRKPSDDDPHSLQYSVRSSADGSGNKKGAAALAAVAAAGAATAADAGADSPAKGGLNSKNTGPGSGASLPDSAKSFERPGIKLPALMRSHMENLKASNELSSPASASASDRGSHCTMHAESTTDVQGTTMVWFSHFLEPMHQVEHPVAFPATFFKMYVLWCTVPALNIGYRCLNFPG